MDSNNFGQQYIFHHTAESYPVNNCEAFIDGFEPNTERYLDMELSMFFVEACNRQRSDQLPLCDNDEPALGRWCRQSRVPEAEYNRIGAKIFGARWPLDSTTHCWDMWDEIVRYERKPKQRE